MWALLHESELARTDPDSQLLHGPMRYDIGVRCDEWADDSCGLSIVETKQSTEVLTPLHVRVRAYRRGRSWQELVVESLVVAEAVQHRAAAQCAGLSTALVHGSSLSASDRRCPGYRDGRRRMIST